MRGKFLFIRKITEIVMNMIKPFKFTTALVLAVGATILATSCSSNQPEPKKVASYLNTSCDTAVYGYNGRSSVKARSFTSPYALPANAKKAMVDYIKGSDWQEVNYIYPQMFVKVNNSVWAVCSNNRGNLTGILPVGKNKDARKLNDVGNYKMLVNKSPQADQLGYAILKNMEPADQMRVNVRKSEGLETITPIAPAPKPVKAAPAPAPKSAATPAPAKPKVEKAEDELFGSDSSDDTTDSTDESSDTEADTTADDTEDTTSADEE